MRKIEAGDYWIGGPETGNIYSAPNSYHKVTFGKDFYVSIFDVTAAQYAKVVDNTTSTSILPQVNVSWNTIRGSAGPAATPTFGFMGILNSKTNLIGFDLPTRSMWEVAARAGDTAMYPGGDDTANLGTYAWWTGNSGNVLHNVGTRTPNAWGLYDMIGNVWLPMRDVHNTADLATLQTDGLKPITTGTAGTIIVTSGSYRDGGIRYRYSARYNHGASGAWTNVGLRCAFVEQ